MLSFQSRADCDAPCFEQLKATHHRASPKQQALLDVLLQLIKTWPLTIGPCKIVYGNQPCGLYFNFASLNKKPNSVIFNPIFYIVKACLKDRL